MGWCSGSDVFQGVWSAVRNYIPEDKRVRVCSDVIITLQKRDWDCEGDFIDHDDYPEFNAALQIAEGYWQQKEQAC